MQITGLRSNWRNGIATADARVWPETAHAPFDVAYRFEGLAEPPEGLAEAFAAAFVTPCMAVGEDLALDGPVSATLMNGLHDAQRVLARWHDYLAPVRVTPASTYRACRAGTPVGTACFFSAGVDSWYSLLKNEARITHLVLVRGFDIGAANDTLWHAARDGVAHVADALNKRLVTCDTNVRTLADRRRAAWGEAFQGDFWGETLHGAALASVALLLRREIGEVIVPATHAYRQLKPWGSSPVLDGLWSDGRVRISHDGCEATRMEKIRAIAVSDVALRTLRVCHHDTAEVNCGECEKCLRTMLALRLCGALDRATTFPRPMHLRRLHGLVVPPHLTHHYHQLHDEARRVGDRDAARTIEVILGRRVSVRRTLGRTLRSGKRAIRDRLAAMRQQKTRADANSATANLTAFGG